MAESVILHIGQMKSGTTALQWTLTRNQTFLRSCGITYPVRGSEFNHAPAVADLLLQDASAMAALPAIERAQLTANSDNVAGRWQVLLDDIGRTSGRVLLSCESFAVLSPSMIESAVEELRAVSETSPEVLITYRPLDELLPSSYMELAKKAVQPPLHIFVNGVLNALPGPYCWYQWMSVPWLRRRWGDTGATIHEIAVDTSDPPRLDADFGSLLGIEVPAGFTEHKNVSFSLAGFLAWQMFLGRHGAVTTTELSRVHAEMVRDDPVLTDRRRGGSLKLSEAAKESIGKAFPQSAEQPPSAPAIAWHLDADAVVTHVPEGVDLRQEVHDLYGRMGKELASARVRRMAARTKRAMSRATGSS